MGQRLNFQQTAWQSPSSFCSETFPSFHFDICARGKVNAYILKCSHLMGRPRRTAVYTEPISSVGSGLLSTVSAPSHWRREPFQATQPFGFKRKTGNEQDLPSFPASTQKPCCNSYMWQVLVLPKSQSFFGYLFLLKHKQVSRLKVPSQLPRNSRDRIKPHRNSTLEA